MGNKTGHKKLQTMLILAAVLALLASAVTYMGYGLWLDSREVFQDVTVELGAQELSLRDFMTDLAVERRARFVTDPGTIDLGQTGTVSVELGHGILSYTVELTVEDTTAPEATVPETWPVEVGEALPAAMDLVSDVRDESAVKVFYEDAPEIPADYTDTDVTVVLEDAHGNRTTYPCTLQFYGWLKESCTLELGQTLTADMVLTDPARDADLLTAEQLEAVDGNTVGTYTVTSQLPDGESSCTVTVQDTTGPTLELKNVRIFPWGQVDVEDFVASAEDLSGDVELRLTQELPDLTVNGEYTITVEAKDVYGNTTQEEAILWVSNNLSPPRIQGANTTLTIEKHDEDVDFLEGVTAKDDIDKTSTVTVDTSTLDVHTAGTYFITYSSTDSAGNVGTYRRKVVVEHDEEDTAALAEEIASKLPDDPEAIRDYVRETIAYTHDWGGDDPTWYGFTTHTGNCYVHAFCLKALLDIKGYETQLIWVTNESHYWLIIKLEEGWRHIDATPSSQHEKIGLATDDVRYKYLNGRNWDRSKWPACE